MTRPIQLSLRTAALAALLAALARPAAAGIARFTAFGPPNGQVFAAASLPDRPGRLLLSTELGGLFRSADGGRSWAWSSLGLGGDTLQAIAPDPSRAATLYGASFGAFYRSDDLGQSWQAVATGQRFGREVEVSLTAAPGRKGQPMTLYLAAGQQLFVSHDLGATWPASRTEGFGVAFRAVAFDPGRPQTAYAAAAGDGGGLLRSTDTGYTWTHIGPALFSQGLTGFAFVPTDPAVLLASASGRFFRSTTGGASWREVPSGLHLSRLLVDPRSPATVYGVFGGAVKVSTDAGATWRLLGDTLANDIARLVVDRASRTLTAFTRYDVFSLPPRAAAWSLVFRSAAHGTADPDAAAQVHFDPADPATVYTVLGARAFRSTDGGGHWTSFAVLGNRARNGDLNNLAVDPGDADRLLLATRFGGLFESRDRGATWTNLGPPGLAVDEILPLDSRTLLGIDGSSDGGILRSADGGASWTRVLVSPVRKLQADPGDPRVVYAAAYENLVPPATPHPFLVKSEDGGLTWRTILEGGAAFALDSARPAGLYALQRDLPVRSVDGGATWQPRGLYPDPTQSLLLDADLLVDSRDAAILYGTSFSLGALRSTDGGLSFAPVVLTPAIDPHRPGPARGIVDERLYADPVVPHRVYLAIARRLYVASF
jgi:photosystem II stability/assembly factor-like uncharacterized protein